MQSVDELIPVLKEHMRASTEHLAELYEQAERTDDYSAYDELCANYGNDARGFLQRLVAALEREGR